MDFTIASILTLDGVTNGAIYALLALATVLVFAVTRVIFIPQGEFVAFGALTLAVMQQGKVPGTVWFLLILTAAVAVTDVVGGLRAGRGAATIVRHVLRTATFPVLVSLVAIWAAPKGFPLLVQAARERHPGLQIDRWPVLGDSAEVLKAYVASFADDIVALRGSPAQIKAALKGPLPKAYIDMALHTYKESQRVSNTGQMQTSSMVKAAEFLGKLHGLIIEKREVTHRDGVEDLADAELANIARAGSRGTSAPSGGSSRAN